MFHFMLLALTLFISLFAASAGIFLMLQPDENWILWPRAWLLGTPFTDFRLPGMLLLVMVGLSNAWGFWNLLKEHPKQYDRAMLGGYCLTSWVMLELLLSRELFLIHVSSILLGTLQVLMAFQQKDKWAL